MSTDNQNNVRFNPPIKVSDHFNLSLILLFLGFAVSCVFIM